MPYSSDFLVPFSCVQLFQCSNMDVLENVNGSSSSSSSSRKQMTVYGIVVRCESTLSTTATAATAISCGDDKLQQPQHQQHNEQMRSLRQGSIAKQSFDDVYVSDRPTKFFNGFSWQRYGDCQSALASVCERIVTPMYRASLSSDSSNANRGAIRIVDIGSAYGNSSLAVVAHLNWRECGYVFASEKSAPARATARSRIAAAKQRRQQQQQQQQAELPRSWYHVTGVDLSAPALNWGKLHPMVNHHHHHHSNTNTNTNTNDGDGGGDDSDVFSTPIFDATIACDLNKEPVVAASTKTATNTTATTASGGEDSVTDLQRAVSLAHLLLMVASISYVQTPQLQQILRTFLSRRPATSSTSSSSSSSSKPTSLPLCLVYNVNTAFDADRDLSPRALLKELIVESEYVVHVCPVFGRELSAAERASGKFRRDRQLSTIFLVIFKPDYHLLE